MSLRILAATRKGLFLLERSGPASQPWRVADTRFLGDNVSMVLCDPRDSRVHAALDHGHFGVKMHRAPEWSAPFEECPAPAYPEKPPGEPDRDQWGKEIPWTTVRVWALEPGGPEEPQALWCGTLPGGLFRSEDSGASWQLVRPLWDHPMRKEWFGGGADLPGIHSICVDPRDSAVVRIGVSCAGVWTTRDRGASWSCEGKGMWAAYMPPERKFDMNVQDPHRIVQCPAAPDRLWAQHHNGIFRSSDAGLTWEDIEGTPPSAFGFPVAVHPRDPDTAWFVPAIKDEQRIPAGGRVVVTRTRDGGRTFAELTRGLPQQHAYDLVYRHALDVSPSGDELAFGSTTGGLWTSDDQGETWQALEARLPPVHAVRFMP